MKNQLITEIQQQMLPYLNNEQLRKLRAAMEYCLHGLQITQNEQQQEQEQTDATAAFIAAKRIEGCSEKTLTYYRNTIETMTAAVGKPVQRITTDDIRQYLTRYQMQRKSSKVTIDNIRRILATFYSWLEDEDYIVKSPVRRIHKVKTAKVIKETYTDEALEQMRDMIKSICYPKCTTCQRAKKWLDDNKIEYDLRDIKLDNPTLEELTEWYNKSGLPLKKFFNTSGLLYKSLDLKNKLPEMSEPEMLQLLATDGMLVKRPLVIGDDFVLVGFKEAEWLEKLNK